LTSSRRFLAAVRRSLSVPDLFVRIAPLRESRLNGRCQRRRSPIADRHKPTPDALSASSMRPFSSPGQGAAQFASTRLSQNGVE